MLALLCSGCELGLSVDIDVNRNGAGQVAVALQADAELLELAEEADADPLGDLVAGAKALEGWRVDDATDDAGARTVTLSSEFADAAEFDALMGELSAALAADEVELLEPFTLTVTDDRVAVAGGASARPRAAVREYGMTRREAVRLVKRADAFRYEVGLTLPGEVLSSTADGAEGHEQRWVVAPGERVGIAAESTRPGPPWVRAVLGAVGGAAAAGAVLWLIARRRA